MSVTVRWLDAGDVRVRSLSGLDSVPDDTPVWVDVANADIPTVEVLARRFGMHPLNIEDAHHEQSRPKIDSYDDSTFLTWLVPTLDTASTLSMVEIDLFVSDRALITFRTARSPVLEEVAEGATDFMRRGTYHLLHAILDRLVDSIRPAADQIGDALDDLEEGILSDLQVTQQSALYRLRRDLLQLHRVITAELDIIRDIQRITRRAPLEDLYRYFGDVLDHLESARETTETYREIAASVMDVYLSAQSNRLNEIMKVLTVATVIIGVGTLISGVYGMNLLGGMWPDPESAYSFAGVIGVMVLLGGIMSFAFRRRNWW